MTDDERVLDRDFAFQKVGLGYVGTIQRFGIEMRLDRLKGNDELHGTLTVARVPEGVLTSTRFNVSSATTRKSMAGYLSGRSNHVNWTDALELMCVSAMLAEARGEPFLEIGQMADTFKPVMLFPPLLLEDDAMILYADGGTGKSAFALAVGVTVRTGREIIRGMPASKTGNVLYLDWETSARITDARLKQVCKGAGIPPCSIMYRRCTRPLSEMVESVAEQRQRGEVALTIVDSAAMAMGTARDGADPSDSATRLFASLAMIGGSSLIVDHVAKVNPDRKPYGSQYKWNDARAAWFMQTHSDGHVVLTHEKHNNTRKFDPFGIEVQWSDDAVSFQKEGYRPPPVFREESTRALRDDIADAIREAGHALDYREIALALGKPDKADSVLSQLHRHKTMFEQVPGGWKVRISGGDISDRN